MFNKITLDPRETLLISDEQQNDGGHDCDRHLFVLLREEAYEVVSTVAPMLLRPFAKKLERTEAAAQQ